MSNVNTRIYEDHTENYSYNCIDKSLLLSYFKNYYVRFYFKFVPRFLTANYITLLSSFLNLIMLFVLVAKPNSSLLAIVAVFCIHGYVVGDHLDGMQAKETKTGSPMGEFLDHYLDVYNGSIVLYVVLELFGNIPVEVFFVLFWLNFLAFGATMMEELETGNLTFGKIGTLEGIAVLIIFLISWAIPPLRKLWECEMIAGYQWYWLIPITIGLGYIFTTMDILFRIRFVPNHYLSFSVTSLTLLYILYYSEVSRLNAWILITLIGGEYIAKVMESYLLRKKSRHPDLYASLLVYVLFGLILLGLIQQPLVRSIMIALSIYLAARVVWIFTRVIIALKMYWHWINRKHGI